MKRRLTPPRVFLCIVGWLGCFCSSTDLPFVSPAHANQLLVGVASVDITPEQPVAVSGQFNLRIAAQAETPLTANVVALESRAGNRSGEAAIMVACDVISIPIELLAQVRAEVHTRLPEIDCQKIFLSGTHTHTAPVLRIDKYAIPKDGVMPVNQYQTFFAQRVADGIVEAWKRRAPGSFSWGLGQAAVAHNRRAAYVDGSAKMYGPTNVADFRGLEGYEDHDIGALFFWNAEGQLLAVAINVACPAQEVESRSTLNADYWHPVRERLRSRHGNSLCILGWVGASGDQSPHLMYRKAADERMRRLRGLNRLDEIARRIVRAVDDVHAVIKDDRYEEVELKHHVETIRLSRRPVTEAEYAEAKAACDAANAEIKADPTSADRAYRRMKWYQVTVERFERQQAAMTSPYEMELHVVRIGDVAICTNAFELFTDYGIRIKARSRANQTFVIQLVGPGTYLPTRKAVEGGHYSAVVHSSLVGPAGGQALVDTTIERIDSLFGDTAP